MTDPNQDTVRSMATLLVEDEKEDKTSISTPVVKNGSGGKGLKPRFTTQLSQTSQMSNSSQGSKQPSDNDPNDSVFGDVPLEDTPVTRFNLQRIHKDSITNETRVPDSPNPAFKRQGSLRSQLSVTSSYKEPKKREIKLKTFVSLLFIIIVTTVAVVLHFAHAKRYQAEIGQKIIVHEDTRQIEYQDKLRKIVLNSNFGKAIPKTLLPHDCSIDKTRQTHLCLRWKQYAELNIDYWQEGSSKCFDASWKAFTRDQPLTDCFDIEQGSTQWFGGWVDSAQTWPIENVSMPLQPFITGHLTEQGRFGPVIERYWISSKGVSIFSTDLQSPLYISWNAANPEKNQTGDGQLCLVSGYEHSIYAPKAHMDEEDLWLNYTVCVSDNILDVHHLSLQQISDIRNISNATAPDMSLFGDPVWSTSSVLNNGFTLASLNQFRERIANLSLPIGLLMLGTEWQNQLGDFLTMEQNDLQNLSLAIKQLQQELNCNVSLGVDPYVSVRAKNFADIAGKNFLATDASGNVPGLIKLPHVGSGELVGVLDVTKPEVVSWFQGSLETLKSQSMADFLNFEGGSATLLPFATWLGQKRNNHNLYTYDYGTLAWANSQPGIVDSATHLQTHPVIVRVNVPSLQQVIPTVLTLGILGYPYMLVDMSEPFGVKPNREQYIRSIQLSAFLPIMHVHTPPDEFGLDTVQITRRMADQHRILVHPRVIRASQGINAIDPIVRPLWWIAPNDKVAATIDSQFVIGDDLIVAPVLEAGVYSRHVYLPEGVWHAKERTKYIGPLWVWNYHIPLNDYAYFTKH